MIGGKKIIIIKQNLCNGQLSNQENYKKKIKIREKESYMKEGRLIKKGEKNIKK